MGGAAHYGLGLEKSEFTDFNKESLFFFDGLGLCLGPQSLLLGREEYGDVH